MIKLKPEALYIVKELQKKKVYQARCIRQVPGPKDDPRYLMQDQDEEGETWIIAEHEVDQDFKLTEIIECDCVLS